MVEKSTKQIWLTKHKLIIGAKFVLSSAFVILLVVTLSQFQWSGFGKDSTVTESVEKTEQNGRITGVKRTTSEQFQDRKTLWDVLELAGTLAVPILITILGSQLQRRDQQRANEQARIELERSEQQERLEKERAKLEKDIADNNLREEALQNYIDRLSELLIDKNVIALAENIQKAEDTENREQIHREKVLLNASLTIIRARTLELLGNRLKNP